MVAFGLRSNLVIDGRVTELRVNCLNWSLSQSKTNPVPIMRCSHFTLYAESH